MLVRGRESSRLTLPLQPNIWHVLCFTWTSEGGDWAFYIDGQQAASGSGLSTGLLIRTGGVWVLGQEQDSLGGGFQTNEASRGDLARFNVWDHVLSREEMDEFHGCGNGGNVIDWDTVAVTPHMDVAFSDLNCSTADVQLEWEFWALGDSADRFQGGDVVTMEYNLILTSSAELVNITLQFHSDDFEDLDPVTISNSSGLLELNGNLTGKVKGPVFNGQKLFVHINVTYTVKGYGLEQFLGPVCPDNNTSAFATTRALPTFNTSWMNEGNLTFGNKINLRGARPVQAVPMRCKCGDGVQPRSYVQLRGGRPVQAVPMRCKCGDGGRPWSDEQLRGGRPVQAIPMRYECGDGVQPRSDVQLRGGRPVQAVPMRCKCGDGGRPWSDEQLRGGRSVQAVPMRCKCGDGVRRWPTPFRCAVTGRQARAGRTDAV
ncbi:NPTXR [Branchiostoma lanceolatum]|uniref:NPTXR protein n=1 Tax=Branchiostoma lanceolatum TaxID=7740 RepID=A0A8J9ZYK1_BRALA|nr:NPTXR [Branchiostoma lanceolatum]